MSDDHIKRVKSHLKFVGLHAHSVAGSPFDGFGFPQEHMDFAYRNGSDAMALTDHGNCNGFAYQVLHARKMMKQGLKFKPIFGVEAYFIDSLEDWHREKATVNTEKKAAKKSTKDDVATATVIEDETEIQRRWKDVLNRRCHMLLLAMSQEGLYNIFKLISDSYKPEAFYRYPRIDYAALERYNKDVIATNACVGGVYGRHVWQHADQGEQAIYKEIVESTRRMKDIFKDRWYGEIQFNAIPEQHTLNQMTIQVAGEHEFDLIATADSHYPNPDAWKSRELYKRLKWNNQAKRPSWLSDDLPCSVDEIGYELYPKNGDQMWDAYKKYARGSGVSYDDDVIRGAIERTHTIAHDVIEDFMPDSTIRLPDSVVPAGKTADEALTDLAIEGLKRLNLETKKEYIDRLKYELKVIIDRGFSKYFLTMKIISDYASSEMLTGAGRGSSAGALLSYCLGITSVDPLRWGLQFERFMRRDATDYPDIDFDCADPMSVKEWLVNRFGADHVAPISNWNTLQLRSLIKDISKYFDIPFKEVNHVTNVMLSEATPLAKKKHGIKAGVYVPTFEETMEYSESLNNFMTRHPEVKEHVEALFGQTKSASRHAGGVVISPELDRRMPLINSGGVTQTPWSEGNRIRHLEPLGFIKFDILGLASLRMVDGAIRHVLKRHFNNPNPKFEDVKSFWNEYLHPERIDFGDQDVYENVFHKGRWVGLFQFTEHGMQQFALQAKPRSLTDLAAVTSIFRPGPLASSVDTQYVEAKESPQYISYLCDEVREVTEPTYGFLVFQEQIALLAHKLGRNISLDEGNMLRKVLTKKGTGKVAETKNKLYQKFIDGCQDKGLKLTQAEELWKKIEYFSGYGFNKSHAVCYSMLSFQCAWMMHYYPVEWMAAYLDKEPEHHKERAINIAKAQGFKIQPCDVNISTDVWDISPDGKALIQPLSGIKGVGDKAVEEIVKCRPFIKIEDMLFNENMKDGRNKRTIAALIKAGAASSLMDERFNNQRHFLMATTEDKPKTQKKLDAQIELYADVPDFTEEEKIEFIVHLTGRFPLTRVVGDDMIQELAEQHVMPISLYDPDLEYVWFVPREVIVKKTKNGKAFYVINVIDSTSNITRIRAWGVNPERDKIHVNRVYMARVDHNEQWGFSTRSLRRNFVLLS